MSAAETIVEAPSGDEAFAALALAWLLELDVVQYLHPAVQAAHKDAYAGVHRGPKKGLSPYLALLGTAFGKSYDDFHLLRWRSNLLAVEQMSRDFPQVEPEGPLPQLAEMPSELQEMVAELVRHRRELPVIMRKDPLLEHGRRLKSLHERERFKPLVPLRPSLGEDAEL